MLQEQLRAYDRHLWLVRDNRSRWTVVYEGLSNTRTHPFLKGRDGCCGEYTRFQKVTTIASPDGYPLDPTNVASLVMRVVRLNDQGFNPVKRRLERSDAAQLVDKEEALKDNADKVKVIAGDVFDTVGVNKSMTGVGANACIKRDYVRANEELGVGTKYEDE
jgi:hypothetical protein